MDVSINEEHIRIIGFIPARVQSTRFPGKPLADICGKPMIMRVYERVARSELLEDVYIATDSRDIFDTVLRFGGKALMTSENHASGTDRIAEAADSIGLSGEDIVVNVQGDQPLIETVMLEEVIQPLLADPAIPMSTLIYRIVRDEEVTHPNAVKTVVDREGFAIYFSRATIPFFRGHAPLPIYYKHHGIYAYRNNFLQRFPVIPSGFLEKAEGLEQLRALENGFRIKTVITDKDSIEVDTPEDLDRVREIYRKII
ncbi:MAG: 3-deoxy-manno-octulosonate cytidylyltransferase [Deltaproteobacteria bacterium]|jgi:3-deoxy-manno-octulosonate cytidylyltransferase (CMP-KDO synthetase)|nr:3-deoxy-manno-octulosonate cytidylyltransferase [Deltaproteobacteria bacterium]